MELINPNEIGTRISTLIVEAQSKVIIVSPYLGVSEWKKIKVSLERAKKRGVEITVYYRVINQKDADFFEQLDIPIVLVKGLHTKLYLSESEAIVSSMNLYEPSDLHSIDIAIHYRDQENYDQLYQYFQKFVQVESQTAPQIYCETIDQLFEYLEEQVPEHSFKKRSTYIFNQSVKHYELLIDLE